MNSILVAMPVETAAAADTVLPNFEMPGDVETTGAGSASATQPADARPTEESAAGGAGATEPTEVAEGDDMTSALRDRLAYGRAGWLGVGWYRRSRSLLTY